MLLRQRKQLRVGGVDHEHQEQGFGQVPLPVRPQVFITSNWQATFREASTAWIIIFTWTSRLWDLWRRTFQKLDVQVVFADGDGVESFRRLRVLIQAAAGETVQQARLSGSLQTQNQNLSPSHRRPALKYSEQTRKEFSVLSIK